MIVQCHRIYNPCIYCIGQPYLFTRMQDQALLSVRHTDGHKLACSFLLGSLRHILLVSAQETGQGILGILKVHSSPTLSYRPNRCMLYAACANTAGSAPSTRCASRSAQSWLVWNKASSCGLFPRGFPVVMHPNVCVCVCVCACAHACMPWH